MGLSLTNPATLAHALARALARAAERAGPSEKEGRRRPGAEGRGAAAVDRRAPGSGREAPRVGPRFRARARVGGRPDPPLTATKGRRVDLKFLCPRSAPDPGTGPLLGCPPGGRTLARPTCLARDALFKGRPCRPPRGLLVGVEGEVLRLVSDVPLILPKKKEGTSDSPFTKHTSCSERR